MNLTMTPEHESLSTGVSASPSVDVADAGIVLFSSAHKLIYMDAQARELSARINLSQSGYSANGILPPSVTMLSAEIVKGVQAKIIANDPTPFEVRRLISDMDHPVLLRGYGFPDGMGAKEGGVLILMEDIAPRKEFRSKQAAERFHLTEREVQIVRNLSKGYTNKEIGCALGLTEQAVKEAMKRIMQKTKTTTRTGILIEILGL